jgi:hypothetical protein
MEKESKRTNTKTDTQKEKDSKNTHQIGLVRHHHTTPMLSLQKRLPPLR